MRRALYLTGTQHTCDGATWRPVPGRLWDLPILEILTQLLAMVCGDGVVIMDATAAGRLGFPTELPEKPKDHPLAVQLRAAGWTCREVFRWTRITAPDGGQLRIGLHGLMSGDHFPLVGTDPLVMTATLARWHDITGHAWVGAAADAGHEILRDIRVGRRKVKPEFWSHSGPRDAFGHAPTEMPYLPSAWRRKAAGVTVATGLDRVRAYEGSMTCTPVAAKPLEHTPNATEYTPKLAGWLLVEPEPWEYADLLPDPAGYTDEVEPGAPRWLSVPRVGLLEELARVGEYRYRITDAWTAPATDVVKQYGGKLREYWTTNNAMIDSLEFTDPVSAAMRACLKGTYRQAHGHWRSAQSSVQRGDWAGAVVAMNGANTWRAAYKILRGPRKDWTGTAPLWIDTDSLYYPGDPAAVAELARGVGWTVWDDLGDGMTVNPHTGGRVVLDHVSQLGHWRVGGRRVLVDGRWRDPAKLVSRETSAVPA